MKRIDRLGYGGLLIALLACLVAPPAVSAINNCGGGGKPRPDEGGVGGTGARPPSQGGIGGTGAHPDGIGGTGAHPDGIGGTGISVAGDTGIIGTITGFGSICVGGLEVHYSAQTPVEVDGQSASASELGVGQVVEVVASGTGDEVQAQSIAMRHVVSGPVQRIDPEHNQIEVLGQTVQLSESTRGDDGAASLAAFTPQSFVHVSGLRRGDGTIVASQVAVVDPSKLVHLNGRVTEVSPDALTVAGVPVRLTAAQLPHVGDEVRVTGEWDGASIATASVETVPPLPFGGRVGVLDIEGYAQTPEEAGHMYVGSVRVEVPKTALNGLSNGERPEGYIRLRAVVRDRHVIAERISVVGDVAPMPPLPDRVPGFGSHGGPDDHGDGDGHPNWWGSDQMHGDGHGGAPPQRPDSGGALPFQPSELGQGSHQGPPDRPSLPNGPPNLPDRPSFPDRPQRPERPNSDRPSHPDRPNLDHPSHPDMPDMHHGH